MDEPIGKEHAVPRKIPENPRIVVEQFFLTKNFIFICNTVNMNHDFTSSFNHIDMLFTSLYNSKQMGLSEGSDPIPMTTVTTHRERQVSALARKSWHSKTNPVSSAWSINGLVYFMKNTNLKWMMTRGKPHGLETSIYDLDIV